MFFLDYLRSVGDCRCWDPMNFDSYLSGPAKCYCFRYVGKNLVETCIDSSDLKVRVRKESTKPKKFPKSTE